MRKGIALLPAVALFASARLPAGAIRLVGEILHVESRRPARELFGDPASLTENQVQVALQWRFPE